MKSSTSAKSTSATTIIQKIDDAGNIDEVSKKNDGVLNETLPLKASFEDTSHEVESNMEPALEEMKIDDVEIDKVCNLESKIHVITLKLLSALI